MEDQAQKFKAALIQVRGMLGITSWDKQIQVIDAALGVRIAADPYRVEAFAAVYPDGEVEGVYSTKGHAERSTAGDDVKIIRLVPEITP